MRRLVLVVFGLALSAGPRALAQDEPTGPESSDEVSAPPEPDAQPTAPASTDPSEPDERIEDGGDGAIEEALPSEPEAEAGPIRYILERVEIRGARRTAHHVIRSRVPFADGEVFEIEDSRLDETRYRLLGTGFFDAVDLAIERGRERGHVVLVVEVDERNTFVLEEIVFGASQGAAEIENYDLDRFFLGLSVAETNLFGTGATLQLSGAASPLQQGVRMRFADPRFLGAPLGLTLSGFFLNAREVYGDNVLVTPGPSPGDPTGPEDAYLALVRYHRGGGSIGTGVLLDPTVRFSAAFQFEVVDVLSRPDAASVSYGTEVVPIDFAIHDRTSFVSTLELGIDHDGRDDPLLTRAGRVLWLHARLGSPLIGSFYEFFRIDALWREWIGLPEWAHTLRLQVYLGAAVGEVPVFYHIYASDLSDLIPGRVLELNLDRRAPPDLLGTAIAENRWADLGGRIDVEYQIEIFRTAELVRSMWGYVNFGLYGLANTSNFIRPVPGYSISVPIDLTFDFGVRLETEVGLFQIGFSTFAGFIAL